MNIKVRTMTCADYPQVSALWSKIQGFAIRSIDDSEEGVARFLRRNPDTCVVAEDVGSEDDRGRIVGSILCGSDGRFATFYHVCVDPDYRRMGIGRDMVNACVEALRKEQINTIHLTAFRDNDLGNSFWSGMGWRKQENVNRYELKINAENVTVFNS